MNNNQRKKFEEAALPHMAKVYNAALYLTNNADEAQDLVQDTYLRAYRFFHQFEEGTNCRAWLLKILQNSFRNRLRSAKRDPVKLPPANPLDYDKPERQVASTNVPTPVEELEESKAAEEITAAISQLPEKLRMAVVLSDIKNLSYQEIARIMGCPVGTVRSRIARGRVGLRVTLKKQAASLGYISPDDGE